MESIREDMEGGIKTLLEEQGKEEGTGLVTLAQFDTEYELIAEGVPVAELEPYRLIPRGSTALLDAIGRTMGHVKGRLDGLDPANRPGNVLIAACGAVRAPTGGRWLPAATPLSRVPPAEVVMGQSSLNLPFFGKLSAHNCER